MIPLVEQYCRTILTSSKCNQLPFHNLTHTLEVIDNIHTIGKYSKLIEAEIELIIIAGWFHDIGFCEVYKGHEEVSVEMAKQFLTKNGYDLAKIEIVISCINATKIPQCPDSKYAEIISDADIFHIGTDAFFYRKLLLRREWEIEMKQISTEIEWHILNLKFLQAHDFFTPYGKSILMEGQKKNEERVKNLICLF